MKREVKTWRNAGLSFPQPIADELANGAVLALRLGVAAVRVAARVAAVEDQARDALRVPHRVGDARRRALRDSEQRERLARRGRFDDLLQVVDPALEGEVGDVPVRHPAAALVVADEAEVPAEEADPVAPDRALPLELEMGEPVRGLDQQRARSRLGPGELHAVARAQIADPLAWLVVHGVRTFGTFVPRNGDDSSPTGTSVPWPMPRAAPILEP